MIYLLLATLAALGVQVWAACEIQKRVAAPRPGDPTGEEIARRILPAAPQTHLEVQAIPVGSEHFDVTTSTVRLSYPVACLRGGGAALAAHECEHATTATDWHARGRRLAMPAVRWASAGALGLALSSLAFPFLGWIATCCTLMASCLLTPVLLDEAIVSLKALRHAPAGSRREWIEILAACWLSYLSLAIAPWLSLLSSSTASATVRPRGVRVKIRWGTTSRRHDADDHLRPLVYRIERDVLATEFPSLAANNLASLRSVQAEVDHLCKKVGIGPITCMPTESSRAYYAPARRHAAFGTRQFNRLAVCHEVAHALHVDRGLPGAAHGREFLSCLVDVLQHVGVSRRHSRRLFASAGFAILTPRYPMFQTQQQQQQSVSTSTSSSDNNGNGKPINLAQESFSANQRAIANAYSANPSAGATWLSSGKIWLLVAVIGCAWLAFSSGPRSVSSLLDGIVNTLGSHQ